MGEGYVVVETSGGVGYHVSISSASPLWNSFTIGEPTILYISHQIRENGQDLYGFASPEERNFFQQLLIVSGVGPKLASSLVAVLGQKRLAEMIMTEDIDGIDAVPGIGRKMAERIIVYLRDKVLGIGIEGTTKKQVKRIAEKAEIKIVAQALERLGFSARERERMIADIDEASLEGKPVEVILRELLGKN